MSLAENYTYYDRIDNLSKAVITPSLILIWSFVDPIQPKVFKLKFYYLVRTRSLIFQN